MKVAIKINCCGLNDHAENKLEIFKDLVVASRQTQTYVLKLISVLVVCLYKIGDCLVPTVAHYYS